MSFFKRKVNLEDYCRSVYDGYLDPAMGGAAGKVVARTMNKELAQTDSRFANVDLEKLILELEYLRFEIFSLAWAHRFMVGSVILEQCVFTKQYLHDSERDDIWNSMNVYNQSVVKNNARVSGLQGEFIQNYAGKDFDSQCMTRAANQTSLGILFKESSKGLLAKIVRNAFFREYALTLSSRLGLPPDVQLNDETDAELCSFISSFYDTCLVSFNEIKV